MNNPAFLVDGQMEKLIVEKLCPNKRVRLTGLNGKDVTIAAIAKKVSALIRLLNGKNYPIVVLIDREDRQESAAELVDLLKIGIRSEGIKDDLIVGVADRMIENWILADWSSFQRNLNISRVKPKQIEGRKGKTAIKKILKHYQETTDGFFLFINSNPEEILRNSPSFNNFVQQLIDLNCLWLNQIQFV